MAMDLFLFKYIISFHFCRQNFDWTMSDGCFIRNRNFLPLASTWVHPGFWMSPCCLYFQFCVFCFGSSAQCCLCLQIVNDLLPLPLSLTFIYKQIQDIDQTFPLPHTQTLLFMSSIPLVQLQVRTTIYLSFHLYSSLNYLTF